MIHASWCLLPHGYIILAGRGGRAAEKKDRKTHANSMLAASWLNHPRSTRRSRGRRRSLLQAVRSAQSWPASWRQPRSAATTCCWHPQVEQTLIQS